MSNSIILDGLEVDICRGEDGTLVVSITGPGEEKDLRPDTSPDIRIWLNEALIYAHGETGDDLSNSGHRTVAEVKEASDV